MLDNPFGLIVDIKLLKPSEYKISKSSYIISILNHNLIIFAIKDSSNL